MGRSQPCCRRVATYRFGELKIYEYGVSVRGRSLSSFFLFWLHLLIVPCYFCRGAGKMQPQHKVVASTKMDLDSERRKMGIQRGVPTKLVSKKAAFTCHAR